MGADCRRVDQETVSPYVEAVAMCARSLLSSPRFWLGFVLVFSFLALSPLRLTAQSTTSEQLRPDMKPKSVLVWPNDLLTLRGKLVSLEVNSKTLGEQLAMLREQLNASETIVQMLSDTLTESSTKLESLTKASEDREALDQKAIDQARGQLLIWGGGGVVVGAAVGVVAILVIRR